MTARVKVLGVSFDKVGMEAAVARSAAFIESGQPHMVVTANPETVMRAQGDRELASILREADLVVADGIGVVGASRWLKDPLPERVPGIELAGKLLALAAEREYRVYLLGGAPGVAQEAARRIRDKHPGIRLVGTHHGFFGPGEEEEDVVQAIIQARPHLLLVGLGMPKQEKWTFHNRNRLGVPVTIGVGGSLDVFAGRVQRAPGWIRRLGLEWFWRLLFQPRRFLRVLVLPLFVLRVLGQGFRQGKTTI